MVFVGGDIHSGLPSLAFGAVSSDHDGAGKLLDFAADLAIPWGLREIFDETGICGRAAEYGFGGAAVYGLYCYMGISGGKTLP